MDVGVLPWYEYFIVAAILSISAAIGISFAFVGGKQKTTKEYMNADRTLGLIPATFSLYMSAVSGILILGNAAECHTHGVQDWLRVVSLCIGHLMAGIVILPTLFRMRYTSVFEYFRDRYDSRAVQMVGSCLFIFDAILYMGNALYTPASAVAAITPMPLWSSMVLMGGVATLYTSIGGLKGVVWSDTFQGIVVFGGVFSMCIIGVHMSGGVDNVWDTLQTGHRAWVTFDPNPIIRMSFWSCALGSVAGSMNLTAGDTQRLCSMKTLKRAQMATLLVIPLELMMYTMTFVIGGTIFTHYTTDGCDPLLSQQIGSPNELFPVYVLNVLQKPVLPGLLLSILFIGAISSVTTSMNTAATITWKDFLEKLPRFEKMREVHRAMVVKFLSLLFGSIGVGVAFAFQYFPAHALQVANSLGGSAKSPMAGILYSGLFFPWINSIGAIAGAVTSFAFHFAIGLGSSIINPYPLTLNSTVTHCPANTTIDQDMLMEKDVSIFFKFSFQWFQTMGVTICIVVGLFVSFITGPNKPEEMNPKLFVPIFERLFCCIPTSWLKVFRCNVRYIEEADSLDGSSYGSDVSTKEEIRVAEKHDIEPFQFDIHKNNHTEDIRRRGLDTVSEHDVTDSGRVGIQNQAFQDYYTTRL